MNIEELKIIVQEIVKQACKLKDRHTTEKNAVVNYAAIFSQNDEEYKELFKLTKQLGEIIEDTPTGPLLKIDGLDTVAGKLKLLKVRKPDETRPERGDADFTVADYPTFKETYLPKSGFKLIKRKDYEMIELLDQQFTVRAYFSHPPLDQQFGLK